MELGHINLTALEIARIHRFCYQDHNGCGKHTQMKIVQEEFPGLGFSTSVTCQYCGKSENVTDTESGVNISF